MGESKKRLLQKRKEALKERKKCGQKRIYDPKIIAEEMLEWAEQETSINFVGFCAGHGYMASLIWRLEKEDPDFSEIYELVKMKLAERRERLMNMEMINYGSWMRYQKGYDPFLSKHEDDEATKKADREKGLAEQEAMNFVKFVKLAQEGEIKQDD